MKLHPRECLVPWDAIFIVLRLFLSQFVGKEFLPIANA